MADRKSNSLNGCNEQTIDAASATKCKSTAGVALLVCASVALSFYYLTVADGDRYRSSLVALRLTHTPVQEAALHYTEQSEGFLVRGRKCQIQDLDPYDKEVRAFVKTISHVPCSKLPPLTTIVKHDGYSEIKVNAKATKSYSPNGVSCCYSVITRTPKANVKRPDDSISISECHPFNGLSVNISTEFVLVKCVTRNRRKEVYKNAHAVVNIRQEIRERLRENQIKSSASNEQPLSVLMVGVDSISRLNSLRTLPKTVNYLNTEGWVELRGYNKIADNTYPNLMAVLTGIEGDSAYEVCLPTEVYRLDNCSFIWRRFQENGYVTAYAEDEAHISTFNYHKVGFVHQPTDYYLRPFMIAAQRELKTIERHSLKYCLGPESAGERILNYAADFAKTFVGEKNFGLFWTNSFSHNDINSPSGMDGVLAKFFKQLHKANVTDDTFIIFFSDHGMRFGNMRQTKIGWFEERLPFAWLWMPPRYRLSHPEAWSALKINSARLTTPYDLHMTLQDLLGGEVVPSSGCPTCHTLLKPMDPDRACEDASISPHWCVCTVFNSVPINDEVVQAAARYVVHRITAYVHEGQAALDENAPHKCASLTLSHVMISQRGLSWDGRNTYYLLFIETTPGRGRYEATVSVGVNNTEEFQLHSSISRLDSYAGQSRCINNTFLKKYCYCR